MRTLVLSLGLLLGTALAGSLGYGFVGFQGGLQGGGGGFGTFQGIAIGGEAWGGPSGSGGAFLVGPLLPWGEGVYLLPVLGFGGESRAGGGFLLDLGVRAFLLSGREGGWLLGLGAGYALPLGFSGGGGYLRVLFGGGGL
ncbi:hypothetical protein [Thermus aquaticus]|jgi:hypothetical protein|uniref:Uncharacterized protein n=1 Tax=Thermus aquaticus (strain ATCC BAA-2747 / Y51MC23) TaxID=498848 RepID=A0ABN4ILW7_THEA5|nr:hypothetical protein [Thermus aquaticus]ALJ91945.1 hypothetical protein TO73_2135 [Thermus aquaticus Y51MC23]